MTRGLLLLLLTLLPPGVAAQEVTIRGRAVRGADSVPAAGLPVSLHRITPDSGGVAARDTTGPDGAFRFSMRPEPAGADSGSVVWLVTARYQDVLYAGRALRAPGSPVEDYMLAVYEARPADSLRVEERRTILVPDGAGVAVTEVMRIANPSDRTLVAPEPGGPGWRLPLPPGASGVEALSGSAGGRDAVGAAGDVSVAAPIPPGGRPVAVRYRLPDRTVRIPVLDARTRHEVLAPPGIEIASATLAEAGTVDVEGASYRRWVGAGLVPGRPLTVEARGDAGGTPGSGATLGARVALAVGILALAGAALAWRRSTGGG